MDKEMQETVEKKVAEEVMRQKREEVGECTKLAVVSAI